MLNMKFERQKANMTLQQLADKIGVHQMTLCKYESEKAQPSLPVLRRMKAVLGVSIDDLVRRV